MESKLNKSLEGQRPNLLFATPSRFRFIALTGLKLTYLP